MKPMNSTDNTTNRLSVNPPLSPGEKTEINHLLKHYPFAGGASIDALKTIQKHRGWVSDSSLVALAEHMKVPMSDLESVATFYNLIFRKPVGDVLVHPCNGVSCMLMGYRKVHQRLKQTLKIADGETTKNNRFTLIPLPCLGACDKAPVMLTNDTLHENITPGDVDTILLQLEQAQAEGRAAGKGVDNE